MATIRRNDGDTAGPREAATTRQPPRGSEQGLNLLDLPPELASKLTAGLDARDVAQFEQASPHTQKLVQQPHIRGAAIAISALAPPTAQPDTGDAARLKASRRLLTLPADQAVGPLARVALHGRDEVAQVAVYGLISEAGQSSSHLVAPQALQALREVAGQAKSSAASLAAARALVVRGPVEADVALPAIVALASGDANGRVAVTVNALQELLAANDAEPQSDDIRQLAAGAGITPMVRNYLSDDVKAAALDVLERLTTVPEWRPRAVEGLTRVAQAAPTVNIRESAALALQKCGEPEAAARAFAAVTMAPLGQERDADVGTMCRAVYCLGCLAGEGVAGARALLVTLLEEDAPLLETRCEAAAAFRSQPLDAAVVTELHAAGRTAAQAELPNLADAAVKALASPQHRRGAAADLVRAALIDLGRTAPDPAARRSAVLASRTEPLAAWPAPDVARAIAPNVPGEVGGDAAIHAALLCDVGGRDRGSPTAVAKRSSELAPLVRDAADPLAAAIAVVAMKELTARHYPLAAEAMQALLARAARPDAGSLALDARAWSCVLHSHWADDATREMCTVAMSDALRGPGAPALRDILQPFVYGSLSRVSSEERQRDSQQFIGAAMSLGQADGASHADRTEALYLLAHFADDRYVSRAAAAAAAAAEVAIASTFRAGRTAGD